MYLTLRSIYMVHNKREEVGVALYASARHAAAPLEPDLVWVDANTGRTKVHAIRNPWGRARVPTWAGYRTGRL